jgi:CRP-like cAMP-binding protein
MATFGVVWWQGGDVTGQHAPRELGAFLARFLIFASLDEVTRLHLAEQLEPVHVATGDVVMAQDNAGDGLFFLLSGRLRVSVVADGAEHVLDDLTRGAIVGEIALLSDRPRSATVCAVRDRG